MVDDDDAVRDDQPTRRLDRTPESEPIASGVGAVEDWPPDVGVRALGFDERYQYEKPLGAGGMGVVTLCLDRQIGRRVALKQLHAHEPDSAPDVLRFLREARIQGQLEHPAIPPVYDLNVSDDGSVYFTMKRVRGLSLRKVLSADPAHSSFSLRRLLSAFSAVCLAVDFAHRRGVIHRDLKPGNIMLGGFGEVSVIDWGIARVPGTPERPPEEGDGAGGVHVPPSQSHVTRVGSVLGTPGYAAPEQLSGDPEQLGPAADVYALGSILFQILTREHLHPRDSQRAYISTLQEVEARPSVRVPDRRVPIELEEACVRATRLDPKERYASARELHDAVERYLDGERDQERRRKVASLHAERSASAFAVSRAQADPDHRARSRALREVGRALALDPDNALALATLRDVLSTVPPVPPEEVKQGLESRAWERVRWSGRAALLIYSGMLVFVPLLLWAGMCSIAWAAAYTALTAIAIAATAVVHRSAEPRHGALAVAMLASTIALGSVSALFGALLLTPAMVAVNTGAFMLIMRGRLRLYTAGAGVLAVAVPAMIEIAGGRYAFDPSGLHVAAAVTALKPFTTLALLVAANVACVVAGAFASAHAHEDQALADRRLAVHTWDIDQLAPISGARPQRD